MTSQTENSMSPTALSNNGSPMTSQANVYGTDMMGGAPAGMINPMMLMGNNNGMNMSNEGGNDLTQYQAMMMMMMQQQQRPFNGD